jgi:hypothetical protein
MSVEQEKPLAYGREEGAQMLGIGLRKYDELVSQKLIRTFRIGKRRLASADALAEFVRKQERANQ